MLVAKKDVYVDKNDKVTTDMNQAAAQVAVAGHVLDERTAKRYGIADELVSIDEPRASRMVMSMPPAKKENAEPAATEPAEAEPEKESASPEIEKPKQSEAKKSQQTKGAKKK